MTSVTSVFKMSKRPVFTFLLQVAGAVSKHLGLNLARCTKAAQLRGSVLGPTRSIGPRDVHVSNLLPDLSLDCQTVDPQQNHPDNPSTIHLAFLCKSGYMMLYVLNDSVATPRS